MTQSLLEQSLLELGLSYGPCWVTLIDEDGDELPVVRRVASVIEQTTSHVAWSAVHLLVPVTYGMGSDRRRRRTVFAAAAGTPCGKPNRLASILVRPDELVTVMPRVSVNAEEQP
jgi:hypothetical protein